MNEKRLLEIGRISRAHGLRGDVLVDLVTDRTERLEPGGRLERAGGAALVIRRSQPYQGRWLVHFEGIEDRGSAREACGTVLLAEPIDDPSVLWAHQLIGAEVVLADGEPKGRCAAIVENPAHDLLELESGALVPVTFVVAHDRERITIDPPAGLFDV